MVSKTKNKGIFIKGPLQWKKKNDLCAVKWTLYDEFSNTCKHNQSQADRSHDISPGNICPSSIRDDISPLDTC